LQNYDDPKQLYKRIPLTIKILNDSQGCPVAFPKAKDERK